jgi:hypothetical protein
MEEEMLSVQQSSVSRRGLVAAALGLAALTLVTIGRPATALPAVQNVEGTYVGTSESVEGNEPGDLVLVIDPPRRRRLTATLNFTPQGGGDTITVAMKGKIAASGKVTMHGRVGRALLHLKGRFHEADPAVPSPQLIAGKYHTTRGGDDGTFSVTLQ